MSSLPTFNYNGKDYTVDEMLQEFRVMVNYETPFLEHQRTRWEYIPFNSPRGKEMLTKYRHRVEAQRVVASEAFVHPTDLRSKIVAEFIKDEERDAQKYRDLEGQFPNRADKAALEKIARQEMEHWLTLRTIEKNLSASYLLTLPPSARPTGTLPTFGGWTVDERLQEFRKVSWLKSLGSKEPKMDTIPFNSQKGALMLRRYRLVQSRMAGWAATPRRR